MPAALVSVSRFFPGMNFASLLGRRPLTLPFQKPAAKIAGVQLEQIANVEERERPLPLVAEEPALRVGKQGSLLFPFRVSIFLEAENRVLDQRHDELSLGLQGKLSSVALQIIGRGENIRLKQGLRGVSGVCALVYVRMQGNHTILRLIGNKH